MKAILEFNLPEEEEELDAATNGMKWSLVCWNLDVELRGYLKYGNEFKSADEALEDTRKKLHGLMDEYNLEFYS